jgi:sugar diacid utilization regulator
VGIVVGNVNGKWFSSSISYFPCHHFSITHYSLFHPSSQMRASLKASLKTARKTLRVTKRKRKEKKKINKNQTILVILRHMISDAHRVYLPSK